jgi:hypothetical protein
MSKPENIAGTMQELSTFDYGSLQHGTHSASEAGRFKDVAWNQFHRNHSRKFLELGTRLFCKSLKQFLSILQNLVAVLAEFPQVPIESVFTEDELK